MTPYTQCSKIPCIYSATTLCRCVGWTWPNSNCYICFCFCFFCFFIIKLYNVVRRRCFSSKQFYWQWSKQEGQFQSKEKRNQIKPNQRHDRALLRTDDKPTTSLPEPWTSRVIREPPTPLQAVVDHLCPSSSETSQGDAPVERAQFPLMNGLRGRKDR